MPIRRLTNRWTAPCGRSPTAAPVPDAVPPTDSAAATAPVVAERPGRLVAVTGSLDGPGLAELDAQLSAVLGERTAFVGLDLSGVTGCGTGLFTVLTQLHARLRARQGWLRLVGLSPTVLAALEQAPIPEILTVYLTSDRAPGRGECGPDETVASEQYRPADTGPSGNESSDFWSALTGSTGVAPASGRHHSECG